MEPFGVCVAEETYTESKSTLRGWKAFLRTLTPTDMVMLLQAPDQTTTLPDGNVAYTYNLDETRQTQITTRAVGRWGISARAATLIQDGISMGYSDEDGYARVSTGTAVETTIVVGCKSTLIFGPTGESVDVSASGPTCLWPESVERTRTIEVECDPPPPPPRMDCDYLPRVTVMRDCHIYNRDGSYSGFDVSEGASLVRATSNCGGKTTYTEAESGFFFIEDAGHDLSGYVQGWCFDDETTDPVDRP